MFYSGNMIEAEKLFDRSIKSDEAGVGQKRNSIYSILSVDWIAYINYFEYNN